MDLTNADASVEQERLYYLDWLRVFAIIMVFVFHNTHIFDFIDWSVKNSTESSGMMLIFLLIHFWSMPFFFLLAGAGAKFALDSRSKKEYITERIKRLVVPFAIGMVLLAPPQGYVESLGKMNFHGSFVDYYPQFFKNLSCTFSLDTLGHNTYHLWFLGFLFLFSLVALPLFICLKRKKSQDCISRIADFCDKKGVIFLFALPILISHLALRVSFPNYMDLADVFYWFIYFLYGYILFSNAKFRQSINKHGKTSLVVAIVCLLSVISFLVLGYGVNWLEYPNYSFQSVLFMILYSLLTWSWIVFLLSFGSRLLNFSNNFLKYSSEAVLPFYLLHQTIILVIGFYVVQWDMEIIYKFLIISSASLLATVGIYDLGVRRLNCMRILFGLKPRSLSCQKS